MFFIGAILGVLFQYREVLQLEEALIVTPVEQAGVESVIIKAEEEVRETRERTASLRQLQWSFAALTEITLGLLGIVRRGRKPA